jgi:hypothetical protein
MWTCFQVLTEAGRKITAFCDTAPYSFAKEDRRFRGAYIVLIMEAVCTSKTSVCFNETKRYYCIFEKSVIFINIARV